MRLGSYVANMYQLGYVTADMDRAVAQFRKQMGIQDFLQFETDSLVDYKDGQAKFRIRVALANLGERQVELIQPIEGVTDFYFGGLDLTRSAAVLHHYGILVEGPEENWTTMKDVVRACGYPIVVQDRAPAGTEGTHFAYVDARPDYGHYLEFLWRGAESQRRHESMADQAR